MNPFDHETSITICSSPKLINLMRLKFGLFVVRYVTYMGEATRRDGSAHPCGPFGGSTVRAAYMHEVKDSSFIFFIYLWPLNFYFLTSTLVHTLDYFENKSSIILWFQFAKTLLHLVLRAQSTHDLQTLQPSIYT